MKKRDLKKKIKRMENDQIRFFAELAERLAPIYCRYPVSIEEACAALDRTGKLFCVVREKARVPVNALMGKK